MKLPALEIENLGKTFHVHELNKVIHACNHINMTLHHGDFVGITGKSGSGKSTILKMIYRTYLPDQGNIFYDSEKWGRVHLGDLDERKMLYLRRTEIGYVSQFLNVIPRTTARQLLQHAVLETGATLEYAQDQAETMLKHFELDPALWDSYPGTFSGGEKLRLNIALAMVKSPRLLLLDEPTASLDSHSKKRVRDLIEQLKDHGTTMLGIFHDLEFMEGLCDQEYAMEQGKVVT
jgi:alpha-D-ribose 1-methylphosphonate 5-triphosphate synthase subunit PhnL